MAGEWTPIEHVTPRKDEIVRLVVRTGRDRFQVLGLMVTFWMWAETMTEDGVIEAPLAALPEFVGGDIEFWRCVVSVGWIELPNGEESELMMVPRADHWLTKGAKSRLLKSRRQAVWRASNGDVDGAVDVQASTTEQKRTVQNCSLRSDQSQTRLEGRSGQTQSRSGPSVFEGLTAADLADTGHLSDWLKRQSEAESPVVDEPSIDDFRRIVEAAEHALAHAKKSPVGLFVTIVSRGDFSKISKAAKQRADERVRTHCEGKS